MRGESVLAAQVFPWNRYIRTRPGYETLMLGGPITNVQAALVGDPWSADLTFGYAIALGYFKDPRALDELKRFMVIAPNSPITKRIVIQ